MPSTVAITRCRHADDQARLETAQDLGPLQQPVVPVEGEPLPLDRELGVVEGEDDQDQDRQVEEGVDRRRLRR